MHPEPQVAVVVTARNEADRIGATIAALADVFPGARIVVADDASDDGTVDVALAAGAEVVRARGRLGKGGAATLGVGHLLEDGAPLPLVVLCDGDLAESARELPKLVEAIEAGEGELAVAGFARRVGGGFGVALRFAGFAIRRLTGLRPAAPISGQRAIAAQSLEHVLPFAHGFGMEIGMTVDAHRAGMRLVEVELDLEHRATGRTAAGFLHRARQLRDFLRVYVSRRAQ